MQTTQSPAPQASEEKKEGFLDFLKELPILLVVAFAIALLIKTFLVQAFYIPSDSMENTLKRQDRVLVSKFIYHFSEPDDGDVVVFVSPLPEPEPDVDGGPLRKVGDFILHGLGLRSSERDFIKRVIATEGETVQIKQGMVFVNDRPMNEPYLKNRSPLPDFGPYTVPRDSLFVMGDNRFNSHDSRLFPDRAIKESSVVGKAFLLIWPPDRVRPL